MTARFALVAAVLARVPSVAGAQPPRPTAADIAFMQGMIGHHAQAVVMAQLVPSRTPNPSIRLLAERIDVSQKDEITFMQRWLEARGAPAPTGDAHAMHHDTGTDHSAPMPGMLAPAQLTRLTAAAGAEFDRLFLQFMIQHHEGALTMVKTLLASPGSGQEPALFAIASDIDSGQRAEIARMRALLAAPTAGVKR